MDIAIDGEVDLITAPSVFEELQRAVAGQQVVVVDLRRVTYLDSRGIRMLIEVARLVQAGGGTLRVVAPETSIAGGVLRITHVQELELEVSDAAG